MLADVCPHRRSTPFVPAGRGLALALRWVIGLATVAACAGAGAQTATTTTAKPNVILVMTDDMALEEMRHLSRTSQALATSGVVFENAFVSNSFCCPSRVTTFTGRYSHNTGIYSNDGAGGGFDAVYAAGLEGSFLPVRLKSAGYTTSYVGKYLNGYGTSKLSAYNYIPPGWDQWVGLASTITYFNYRLNENGTLVSYGSDDASYITDVFARKSLASLDGLLAAGKPFFLMVAPVAPHQTTIGGEDDESGQTAVPAPRHAQLMAGLTAPRSASFNEADTSDKPQHIRALPLLTDADIEFIDRNYRTRAQSLQAVDEMMAAIMARLQAHPAGANTYVIFTSDNGFFFGDHRIKAGKGRLFDPAHRVPLLMAGPGILKGVHRRELVLNTDLAPTVASWTGAKLLSNVDGRTLDPLLRTDQRAVSGWARRSMLLSWVLRGKGLRLGSYAYYETATTTSAPFVELYDLTIDPDETTNLAPRLTTESAKALSSALAELGACAAGTCRSAENKHSDALVKLQP